LFAFSAGCGGGTAMPDGGIVAACETPIAVQSVPGMPCRFPIPAPPCDVVDSQHIHVIVNGTMIAEDTSHTNGWDYSSFTTVDIYGPSCDAITAGTVTAVSIQFHIYGPAFVGVGVTNGPV
jgi:hypothetical protein